jgi:hypothetical protein
MTSVKRVALTDALNQIMQEIITNFETPDNEKQLEEAQQKIQTAYNNFQGRGGRYRPPGGPAPAGGPKKTLEELTKS